MTEAAAPTLADAARQYLESLAADERDARRTEVQRFIRWCGPDRTLASLRGQDVANYAETLTGGVADPTIRAETVRAMFAFARKAGLTPTNLGTHLRLRKTGAAKRAAPRARREVHLSQQEHEALVAELESLKAQRPKLLEDIRRAMADKDFRENAPLDAAREQQAYIEGRIRSLELTLDHAVIDEGGGAPPTGDGVRVGSTVVVRNLRSGAETTYTLVQPADVDAARGRISVESPVGKALHQRQAGEEVEVAAPSGALRLRIERIQD
jgi:transcription elongation factor GreA